MKSIRVLMMTMLLATATAVSAQTPPQSSPSYFPPTPSYAPAKELEDAQTEVQKASECPFAKAMQDANIAWQRLRALCGAAGMPMPACCESNACKGAGCCMGITAGCVKGCEKVQAPKSCCCAKECDCCEKCKAAKAQEAVQVEQIQMPTPVPFPMMPPMAAWRMQAGPAVVQIVAQPMACPMGAMPHCLFATANLAAKPAKLVTPDFEAHCDHMIQKGDSIQLIGNVLLLCKKYAQPLRVEGQRIVLNLNDGSFVVETGPALPRIPALPAGVGVFRMSITEEAVHRVIGTPPCRLQDDCVGEELRSLRPVRPAGAFVPASGIIEVVPVPPAPVTAPRPR